MLSDSKPDSTARTHYKNCFWTYSFPNSIKAKTELSHPWKLDIKLIAEILRVEGLIRLKPNGFVGTMSCVVAVDDHNSSVGVLLRSPLF